MGIEIEVTLCNPHGKAAFPVVEVNELLKGEFYTYEGAGYVAAVTKDADTWHIGETELDMKFEKTDGRWTATVYWDNGNRAEFKRDTLDEILLHFWKSDNE